VDDPRGEQLINCPFCDEDPREPGHFVVGKLIMERPAGLVVQLALTCLHALPDERRDRWDPWTFFLTEQVVAKAAPLGGEGPCAAGSDPDVPLAEQDEAWASELGRRLEEGTEADDDEAA
jgi:hypothetical protein